MASNEVSRGLRRPAPAHDGIGSIDAYGRPSRISGRHYVDERQGETEVSGRSNSAITALQAVIAPDLAPLANMSTDHMIAQLTRIEYLVGLEARTASGADAQSLDIGLSMIGETIRRLRLVQSAGDRLVVGGS